MLYLAYSSSVLLSVLPVLAGATDAEVVERRFFLMGTEADIVVEATDRASALAVSEAALLALERTEDRLSTWRDDTELAALNRAPVGRITSISPELAEELAAAFDCGTQSDGAFDPTIGSLVDAWDLRRQGRRPPSEELAEAMGAAGMELLRLGSGVATRLHPGLKVEEGGFGKGAALDRAAAAIVDRPALERARIDLGGQVLLIGAGRWQIGVAHPDDRELVVARLTVEKGSVATTANSERGRAVDGASIGHVLDPRTGRPAPTIGSVTVWDEGALRADCASTALFVAGPERALALAGKLGVEALVLVPIEGEIVARATPGLASRIEPLVEELRLQRTGRHGDQKDDGSIRKKDRRTEVRQEKRGAGPGTVWRGGPLLPQTDTRQNRVSDLRRRVYEKCQSNLVAVRGNERVEDDGGPIRPDERRWARAGVDGE